MEAIAAMAHGIRHVIRVSYQVGGDNGSCCLLVVVRWLLIDYYFWWWLIGWRLEDLERYVGTIKQNRAKCQRPSHFLYPQWKLIA